MTGEPAAAQLDPRKLRPWDTWTWACPVPGCALVTQGGYGGLEAHLATVHPERALHLRGGWWW